MMLDEGGFACAPSKHCLPNLSTAAAPEGIWNKISWQVNRARAMFNEQNGRKRIRRRATNHDVQCVLEIFRRQLDAA